MRDLISIIILVAFCSWAAWELEFFLTMLATIGQWRFPLL
jgi:hypothetical protein